MIYKYGTGMQVPENSTYMRTVVEVDNGTRYVWHYFLVEVDDES